MPRSKRSRRTSCGSPTGGGVIQSLLFPRDSYTSHEAQLWALEHDFRVPTPDVKPNTIRLRQRDPSSSCRYTTKALPGASGVSAVYEFPKLTRAVRERLQEQRS